MLLLVDSYRLETVIGVAAIQDPRVEAHRERHRSELRD
jgi:hypothetical protein